MYWRYGKPSVIRASLRLRHHDKLKFTWRNAISNIGAFSVWAMSAMCRLDKVTMLRKTCLTPYDLCHLEFQGYNEALYLHVMITCQKMRSSSEETHSEKKKFIISSCMYMVKLNIHMMFYNAEKIRLGYHDSFLASSFLFPASRRSSHLIVQRSGPTN